MLNRFKDFGPATDNGRHHGIVTFVSVEILLI